MTLFAILVYNIYKTVLASVLTFAKVLVKHFLIEPPFFIQLQKK